MSMFVRRWLINNSGQAVSHLSYKYMILLFHLISFYLSTYLPGITYLRYNCDIVIHIVMRFINVLFVLLSLLF